MNVSSDLKKTLRWAVPAACALIVLAAGVVKYKSGEQPADPGEADKPVGMVNPIAEKASLKEVEDALGL
ncbi:MAG: hypothetical protein IJM17_01665, partial [Firmicutes bacterium]|nr:hypothetical protein [Bacillota bacterium]